MKDTEAMNWVKTATDEELDFAKSLIRQEIEHRALAALKIGSIVSFDAKRSSLKEGMVVKINRKSVKVMVGKVRWTVSPELLKVVG